MSKYQTVELSGRPVDEARKVKIFKALSNPNRLRLFEAIRTAEKTSFEHGCSLRAVVERLSVGAPTVSHHLKELVNAGLVQTEKQGKFLHCSVLPNAIDEMRTFFDKK